MGNHTKFSHIFATQTMNNIPRRNKMFSDKCSSLILTTCVICCFLLLFSYTDTLTNNVNNGFPLHNIVFSDVYEDADTFVVQRYTWRCRNNKCEKFLADKDEELSSLNTCNMLCSQPGIWPKPANLYIANKSASIIDKTKIAFNFSCQGLVQIMLQNTTDLFIKNLESVKPGNQSTFGIELNVNIIIFEVDTQKLTLSTNERYQLTVRKADHLEAVITAENYFGARHGLETLSQLIWYDEVAGELKMLHDVEITDFPKFPYRGLMVDTARNYFPISLLRKVIDGMSMSKLNVLHLHLTDAVSFPIVLPRLNRLASFGAYGPDMIYKHSDIRDLVEYGLTRGIRVLLEIDAPSHVNAGWDFGRNNLNQPYVICGETDILNGHLNPDNEESLEILEEIYRELLELSGNNELFHIGSDEVNLTCWKNTEAVRKTGTQNSLKTFWADYTNKMLDRLKSANEDNFPDHVIMWSSPLTEATSQFETLNKKMTVQFWLGNPSSILNKGHKVIYSTVGFWYLDCGFGPWKPSMRNGVCDPYTPWQKFYTYRPWITHGHQDLALGGEVCLWTEQVDVDTLETRIWPRSAAFAERVWSDPSNFNDYDVYTRLVSFRDRLKSRGIQSAGMWPRWCSQNPGKC